MNRNKIVFLDLDGVIRDFVQGVINRFGLDITHNDVNYWEYFTEGLKDPSYFWEQLNYDFWANLPFTKEAKEILKIVEPYKPIILTSPTLTSAGSTQEWIRKNLPDYFNEKRYLIGPAKWACANPYTMLIDDYDKNIELFKQHGGYGTLWPAPWNKGRNWSMKLELLRASLELFDNLVE